jgi:hypothetical protein
MAGEADAPEALLRIRRTTLERRLKDPDEVLAEKLRASPRVVLGIGGLLGGDARAVDASTRERDERALERFFSSTPCPWPTSPMAPSTLRGSKDKVVVVGTTAVGTFDQRVTPFDLLRPGPHHARGGHRQPVVIYELRALGAPGADEARAIEIFEAGVAAHRSRAWGEAEERFRAVLGVWKGDGPSSHYLDDIAEKRLHPPGEDWDGGLHGMRWHL